MPLPASWPTVLVYGTYLRLDGTPNQGSIWFETDQPVVVTDTAGVTIGVVPRRQVATLDNNGHFEIELPVTDAGALPTGWTYQVTEQINGGQAPYSIELKSALVPTGLNLVTAVHAYPVLVAPPVSSPLVVADLGVSVARQSDLVTAQNTANSAASAASTALTTATNASTAAATAQTAANAAQSTADGAVADAAAAQTTADSAGTAAAAAQSDATTALANAATAQSAANAAQSTANAALLRGVKNRLFNAQFRVNQQGYVSGTATTAANQYTLDRWRVVTSGQNLTFAASGNGYQVTAPAGGMEQVIEGVHIEGGIYTLSWTGTATATVNGTAIANGGQTAALPANTNVTVRFTGGTLERPQFELGSATSTFEQRPLTLEELLCRRYCVVGTHTYTGMSGVSSQYTARPFPVPMRAVPSITVSGYLDNDAAGTGSISSITATTTEIQTVSTTGAATKIGRYFFKFVALAEL